MDSLSRPENRRKHPRSMCSDLIELSFIDDRGRAVRETGLLEDISSGGLCLSLSLPVDPGRGVRLNAEGLDAQAKVRYCELGDYGYLTGVEFAPGYGWDHTSWRPKHLLSFQE